MLSINNITKKYHKTLANNNVSFNVFDSQIAILMGPNGAGKSTLIKCIAGLLRYDGNIAINGLDNKSIEAKKILAYIPELPAPFDLLTVEEHLQFIARAYKLTNWQDYADELLERMELTDKKKKLGKELSKGMQQKLSICCGLLPRPRVILFDEPLVGLDPHAIRQLKEIFKELKEQGCSILISTHMIDSVDEFWDTAIIMMNGEVAAIRTKEDIKDSDEKLDDLFFAITENGKA